MAGDNNGPQTVDVARTRTRRCHWLIQMSDRLHHRLPHPRCGEDGAPDPGTAEYAKDAEGKGGREVAERVGLWAPCRSIRVIYVIFGQNEERLEEECGPQSPQVTHRGEIHTSAAKRKGQKPFCRDSLSFPTVNRPGWRVPWPPHQPAWWG